jgi:hypothetical protein
VALLVLGGVTAIAATRRKQDWDALLAEGRRLDAAFGRVLRRRARPAG